MNMKHLQPGVIEALMRGELAPIKGEGIQYDTMKIARDDDTFTLSLCRGNHTLYQFSSQSLYPGSTLSIADLIGFIPVSFT